MLRCKAAGARGTFALPMAAPVAKSSLPATAHSVTAAKQSDEAPDRELAGTSWRLVKITSMNDRVYEPDDSSKYTLDFGADGTAAMLADCNRGAGTWTSASASQLRFGPIAATPKAQGPASLKEIRNGTITCINSLRAWWLRANKCLEGLG